MAVTVLWSLLLFGYLAVKKLKGVAWLILFRSSVEISANHIVG